MLYVYCAGCATVIVNSSRAGHHLSRVGRTLKSGYDWLISHQSAEFSLARLLPVVEVATRKKIRFASQGGRFVERRCAGTREKFQKWQKKGDSARGSIVKFCDSRLCALSKIFQNSIFSPFFYPLEWPPLFFLGMEGKDSRKKVHFKGTYSLRDAFIKRLYRTLV